MDVHNPELIFHGPCVEHDYACPVHRNLPAVLNMSTGVFEPSWKAQEEGWALVKADSWFKKFVLRKVFGIREP